LKKAALEKFKTAFLTIFAVCFAVVFAAACGKPKELAPPDPNLVSAVTKGSINIATPVQVVFNAVQDTTWPLHKNVFTVKNASGGGTVAGEASWLDQWTLLWQPQKTLTPGAKYIAYVDMARLGGGADSDAAPFSFTFIVEPLSLNVSFEPVQVKEEGLMISGVARTSAKVDSVDIEKIFRQSDLGVPSWTHEDDAHYFTFPPLKPEKDLKLLEISWTGKLFGSQDKGTSVIQLPGSDKFEVVEIRGTDSGVIEVVFSTPLKKNQDVLGYISITNYNSALDSALRYRVDDNIVRLFADNGDFPAGAVLKVRDELSDSHGRHLSEPVQYTVPAKWDLPELRFTGRGTILPTDQGAVMAVETRNLAGLLIEAFAVTGDNMIQFLQVNALDGRSELERVGETVWTKEFTFDWREGDKNVWVRRGLDLSALGEKYPGGMFYLRMSFRHRHIKYSVSDTDISTIIFPGDGFEPIVPPEGHGESSYWNYYQSEKQDSYQNRYQNRKNPNHPAYYESFYDHDITVGRNVLVSDLGLLAKRGLDGRWFVAANNVRTTEALQSITVRLVNYQGRVLSEAKTDRSGLAAFEPLEGVYFGFAETGQHRAYIKLNDSLALATSHFDVAGGKPVTGIRGLIYGERGVWRPGDEIYLTFLLSDAAATLPANHPVTLEFEDPRGRLARTLTYTASRDGFYPITLSTPDDAPTGNWTARVKVGGSTFTKTVKIETIMPNRLGMELDFSGKTRLEAAPSKATLEAAWLYGAPAPGLEADISVSFTDKGTAFAGFSDYNFIDPSRSVSSERSEVFKGTLNDASRAEFTVNLKPGENVPGFLDAHFLSRVFEPAGVFSSQQFSVDFSPYSRYVGIKLPRGDAARNMLLTDTPHQADIALLDGDGKPVSGQIDIDVALYKLNWRWWWEKGGGEKAEFENVLHRSPVSQGTVKTQNGKARWEFKIQYPEWGRYLLVARDSKGGHSAASVVYIDWPGWAGRSQEGGQGAAAMLTLSPEKPKVNAGEKIAVSFPSNKDAAALVSVEKGGEIISKEWIKCSDGSTRYEFKTENALTPNVYVHVTLLQPHLQTVNDLPLRLYGVTSIAVEDPATILRPVITSSDKWEAESRAGFTIKEASGRAMTYTAVVVDEGLLGLTRFKLPEPRDTFYAREASFVKTWDIYSDFMGAYSGKLETLLAIGGGDDILGDSLKETKRFKPVVKYFAPVTLAAGQSRTEEFELPPYIGAVRIMVLAASASPPGTTAGASPQKISGGSFRAYGTSEKKVTVASDLMIFQTAPRVLSPNDEAVIPVTVANYKDGRLAATVKFSMRGEGGAMVSGGRASRNAPGGAAGGPPILSAAPQENVSFDKAGEKTVNFSIRAGPLPGKIEITAVAGSPGLKDAISVINLEVRSTALPLTNAASQLIGAGESGFPVVYLPGEEGTNAAKVELSRLPSLGLETRLDSLVSYPHGCVEQTTSAVFPQLYLEAALSLTDGRRAQIRNNINAGIERLAGFQTPSGGFAYWPADAEANSWGTNYAGHFLLEAKKAGFLIPFTLDKWVDYQRAAANQYSTNNTSGGAQAALEQAYRLYTLALAGNPELGAMNRLREARNLPSLASWQLAAAYWYAGQRDGARTLVKELSVEVAVYRELSGTFGSALRDKAIILETLALLGQNDRIMPLYEDIAAALSTNNWLSTQETAYALIAAAPVLRNAAKTPLSVTVTLNDRTETVSFDTPAMIVDMGAVGGGNLEDGAAFKINNRSAAPVYARASVKGTPAEGAEPALSQGLGLTVEYRSLKGAAADPDKLAVGDDMEIRVTVRNLSSGRAVPETALVHIIPAAWEIVNTRLGSGSDINEKLPPSRVDYQDIRDDRVMSYFDLPKGGSRTVSFVVNRAYRGTFFRPAVRAYAMYDESICAVAPGARAPAQE
jgi:uncharacterized protein YfaS (alpha-2-macroglobulin family)